MQTIAPCHVAAAPGVVAHLRIGAHSTAQQAQHTPQIQMPGSLSSNFWSTIATARNMLRPHARFIPAEIVNDLEIKDHATAVEVIVRNTAGSLASRAAVAAGSIYALSIVAPWLIPPAMAMYVLVGGLLSSGVLHGGGFVVGKLYKFFSIRKEREIQIAEVRRALDNLW